MDKSKRCDNCKWWKFEGEGAFGSYGDCSYPLPKLPEWAIDSVNDNVVWDIDGQRCGTFSPKGGGLG